MIGLSRLLIDRELARWRNCGHRPRLWWRDDDARTPEDRLERLLRTADGLPLSLAVIPEGSTGALARRLALESGVTVSQHGVTHRNSRNRGDPACEYAIGISIPQMIENILQGGQQLRDLGMNPRFYTPPWNHIDESLLEALRLGDYRTLSAWNDQQREQSTGLKRLDVHVDLLRWKGGPRFRGAAQFLNRMREQLAERRAAGEFKRPIGLLTHHLDHDEAAWRFLGWFVGFARPRFEIGAYFDFLRN